MLLTARSGTAVQELTGVVSMFAGIGSFGAAVVQWLPDPDPPLDSEDAADELAVTVREQWQEEAVARQLREPRVIPLSWAPTGRPVAAPVETVVGSSAGRVTRLRLDGRLEGDFPEAASRLAAGFRQVDGDRMVVLGEPGAGKTVLALMLTLGLLADRPRHGAVPVLLSVSGWDPVSESLDDWIVRSVAASYYGGQPRVPRRLLDRRLLLPVLDGLDEMPEQARRSAVRALNDACGDGRGVVLTCRSAEYEDVIEGGSPPLRRAPVIEVAPVPVADAVAYLREVHWPDDVDWEPVYDRLRRDPDGPAAAALSTPLALSLARTVYRNCRRDPGELLGFDSRHAVEDHLVDHLVPAAYAPPPGSLLAETEEGARRRADGTGTPREERDGMPRADRTGAPREDGTAGWQEEAERAERWLTFLATYLHRYRERDLAWWLMAPRLLSRWAGLMVGIGIGVITMLAVTALSGVFGEEMLFQHVVVWIGTASGLLAMLTWYAAPDRPPGRVSFARRGSLYRLAGGFRTGFALTSLGGGALLATLGVILTADPGWTAETVPDFFRATVITAGVATAIGLALAVHEWLDTPPAHSARTTPTGLLRQDRRSALLGAGLAGTVLGATGLPLLIVAVSLAYAVFLALRNPSALPPVAELLGKVSDDAVGHDGQLTHFIGQSGAITGDFDAPLVITMGTVLPGAVFAVLILLHRSWTKFFLLHVLLAARGSLPWGFVTFLAEARERQLLRRSGGTYQFRHIRLQERLASRSLAQDRLPVPPARTTRRRRLRLAVAGAAVAASVLLVQQAMPADTARTVLPTGDVRAMAFGPRGTHGLVTVDGFGHVRRWDTDTAEGATAGKIDNPDEPPPPEFSLGSDEDAAVLLRRQPLGNDATKVAPKMFRVPWDGSPRLEPATTPDAARSRGVMGLSADGRHMMLADSGTRVRLWGIRSDTKSPYHRRSSQERRLAAVDGATITSIHSDSEHIGSGRIEPDRIDVHDLRSGKRRCTIPEQSNDPLASAADGTRFATYRGRSVHLWDSRCRRESVGVTTHKQIDRIALGPEGDELAVVSDGVTRVYALSPPQS